MTTITSSISHELIDQAMSYTQYKELIDQLFSESRTTGNNHSEAMIEYTRINIQRMKRWDKTSKVGEEAVELVKKLDRKQVWLVLTEGWCGDGAQNMPYIEKLAAFSDLVEVKYILRDENLEVMDDYLTNGGRSIPKLIALDKETLEELFTWGPRPSELQKMVMDYKADPQGVSQPDFNNRVHLWYAKDKNQTLERDFVTLLSR
ncbi:thioredoxin family protein [Echinicola sp. 20G]|uniref:thioredoxin family protein n=1 Tax=Echinicola sp. 20G TaxID=2781961 RepID=UPI0019106B04|nr:thioredoxin family protein [Echinicola sp. 20G]